MKKLILAGIFVVGTSLAVSAQTKSCGGHGHGDNKTKTCCQSKTNDGTKKSCCSKKGNGSNESKSNTKADGSSASAISTRKTTSATLNEGEPKKD